LEIYSKLSLSEAQESYIEINRSPGELKSPVVNHTQHFHKITIGSICMTYFGKNLHNLQN
jgi:hypothetical protein